jgi:ribosome-associated protein
MRDNAAMHAHDVDAESVPSRSQQRRDALAVLALAEQLVAQPPAKLARVELPEDVRAEIANVRRISAHGARKRQMAYLAKLMRRHDDEAFAAARAALGEDRERQHRDNATLHRLESLRQSLLDDGDEALSALIAQHPDADRQRLRALIRQARSERDAGKPPTASRELFRLLRELVGGD